jgi:hypothetical protein
MVRTREGRSIPDRLLSFFGDQLAWHLDWFPTFAPSSREPLGLTFTEGHPDRLPARELASTRGALRHGKKQAVTHEFLV